jgi:hypothetical protein
VSIPNPGADADITAVIGFLDELYAMVDTLRAGDPPPPEPLASRLELALQKILTAIEEAREEVNPKFRRGY